MSRHALISFNSNGCNRLLAYAFEAHQGLGWYPCEYFETYEFTSKLYVVVDVHFLYPREHYLRIVIVL